MDRRNFLKYFSGLPILALPTNVLSKSEPMNDENNDLQLEGHTTLSNCNITMTGSLILQGDYQSINSCHFKVTNDSPAIKMENTPKNKLENGFGLAPIKFENKPLYYDHHRKTSFK